MVKFSSDGKVMPEFSWVKSPGGIVIVPSDTLETITVHASNPNYDAVIKALANPDTTTAQLVNLASPAQAISKLTSNYKNIEVAGGVLLYDGVPVHSVLADRIVEIASQGLPVAPWARFAENVYRNPAAYARDELYLWLEKSNLPITPDGHFLAYKRVNDNYTDVFSGKFDNSIGATPSMPRENVDSDRSRTCSAGLHFASKDYIRHFSGARIMIVKVNPEHVVSIPNDYGNAKGRACQYTVIGEVAPERTMTERVEAVETKVFSAVWNDTPKGKKSILTDEIGWLSPKQYKKAITRLGTTAWADSLGVDESVIADWRERLGL